MPQWAKYSQVTFSGDVSPRYPKELVCIVQLQSDECFAQ